MFQNEISHQSEILSFRFFDNFSKYDDVSNFNFNIRKQHNTINLQIRVYNMYRKQYITNGKNWRKWKFSPKKKDDVII